MHSNPVFTLRRLLPALLLAAGLSTAQAQEAVVLAEINGEPITERELDLLVEQQTQGRSDIPPAQRRQFLQETINLMLLAQAGEADGLEENPDLQAQLNNNRRTSLAQAFVRQLTSEEPVAESVLRERYEAEYGGDTPLEYKARHILVSERDQAEGIIERLENGEDFTDLARQYSQDGSSERGGDLGWFAAGDMVAPFSEAVAGLNAGELTAEPVETRFGWHVIRLDETRETAAPAFGDVAGQLRMRIINERIQERLATLRDNANIDYEASWATPDNG